MMKKQIKVYLASPFFNDKEVKDMEDVKNILREKGLDVFAPFENQNKHLEFGSMEWREATFKSDMDAIYDCDVMVAILDGNYSDSGSAFECGVCHQIGKPLIIVNLHNKEINLMIAQSLHAVINSLEELEKYDFNEMPKIPYLDYCW